MDKIFTSLGLMSGTSMDGIDASVIKSDGEKVINIEKNEYLPFSNSFQDRLRNFINQCNGIEFIKKNKNAFDALEKELTLYHIKISDNILKNYKDKVDLIGFHGQTIIHRPDKKYTVQMGNANFLSQELKTKVIYDFRANDLRHNGNGAPLASIFHFNISKKNNLNKPTIFLNIGGISNITYVKDDFFESKDIGPGNVLMDEYIKKTKNINFDEEGKIAGKGTIDYEVIKKILEQELYNTKKKHSLDRKDYNYNFVRGLEFENALATLTFFSASIISDFLNNNYQNVEQIILCGGGRKNLTLIKNITDLTNKKVLNIDKIGIDGDFVESQAFAYLAIRSFLNKNLSFPNTTNVSKPVTGGVLVENF